MKEDEIPPLWTLKNVALTLLVAFLVGLLVQTFAVRVFSIPSGSMEPTLEVGDRIVVEKWNGWLGKEPKTGDIIVFRDPGDWLPRNKLSFAGRLLHKDDRQYLVKRVIGVPGDSIVCCTKQGELTINGTALHEPYLPSTIKPSTVSFSVEVPKDKFWVMGDNRPHSKDSRFQQDDISDGFVAKEDIEGKAIGIVIPFSRLGSVS